MNWKHAVVVLVLSSRAWSADLYVWQGGNPEPPYDRWSRAFTNLQDALNYAGTGDVIRVAGGVYELRVALQWPASATGLTVMGGYEANGDDPLPGPRDIRGNPTVLQVASGVRQRVITMTSAADAVLSGLTISRGVPPDGQWGGGLWISNSTVRLEDVEISDCRVSIYYRPNPRGGGLYAWNSTGTMIRCVVQANVASNGYAAASERAEGGGMCIEGGAWTIRDTEIRGNLALKSVFEAFLNRGGGVVFRRGIHSLENCAIAGNLSKGSGSALFMEDGTTRVRLLHCTVAGNQGGVAVAVGGGELVATNSIFWGNFSDLTGTASLHACLTEDGVQVGTNGNLQGDPMFERGLYLSPNSPCVDAGVGTAADWGLETRTTRVDGGADTNAADMGYHFAAGLDAGYSDLYVAVTGSDTNAGDAEAPFRTLTYALGRARDGTRIHVGPGLYTNGASGGEQFPLVISNRWGIQILGPGRGEAELRVVGGVRRRLLEMGNIAGDSRIEGLTFAGGYPPDGQFGGGALLFGGQLSIRGCAFTNNQSYVYHQPGPYGGGIHADETRLELEDCVFLANQARNGYAAVNAGAGYGGAISMRGGRARIRRTQFLGNRAWKSTHVNSLSRGGALYFLDGRHEVEDCLAAGNFVHGLGGFASLMTALVWMRNVTAAGNTTTGVHRASGTVSVTNCIFWGNGGGDLEGFPVSEGVTEGVWYTLSESGVNAGTNGCISADPLFVSAPTGDYRLRTQYGRETAPGQWVFDSETSPAIDAGWNWVGATEGLDLDGRKRVARGIPGGTLRVDLGAYESHPRLSAGVLILMK